MRIGIFGAGAVGCVVGGMLTRAGRCDVTLVDQWPEHVDAINERGLRLSGTCGEHLVRAKAIHLHQLQAIEEPFDVIFLAVKSYDTEWTVQLATSFLRPDTGYVVDFQNGMNDERVASIVGRERTVGCVIAMLVGLYEPGHAMRTDRGAVALKLGELDGIESARTQQLADLLQDVGKTVVTTNLFGERWAKLAVNCMANPLAALSGLGSADVRSLPRPRRIAIHLAAEAARVGRACGHDVGQVHGIAAQRFIDAVEVDGGAEERESLERDMTDAVKVLTGGRPSMLQDVMRKRKTEIDFINGHVVREGLRTGIPTPFNAAIVDLIRRHGVGTLDPTPTHLDPLVRMLPEAWKQDLG